MVITWRFMISSFPALPFPFGCLQCARPNRLRNSGIPCGMRARRARTRRPRPRRFRVSAQDSRRTEVEGLWTARWRPEPTQLPGENRGAGDYGDERRGANARRRLHAARHCLQRRDVVRIADVRTALHRRIAVVLKRRVCGQRRGVGGCGASTDMRKPQVARRPQQDGHQRDRGKRYEDTATNRQWTIQHDRLPECLYPRKRG